MAIGTHDVALGDFGEDFRDGDRRVCHATDEVRLIVSMIEVHHIVRKAAAAVGARFVLGAANKREATGVPTPPMAADPAFHLVGVRGCLEPPADASATTFPADDFAVAALMRIRWGADVTASASWCHAAFYTERKERTRGINAPSAAK
jgi:hypothetical protein